MLKASCLALLFAVAVVAMAGELGRISVPDVPLLDQDGNRLLFYSDLVKDRIAVINFVFTSCPTICSPMGATFGALQKKLGEASDVQLISVSIDPATDTPARLKRWSQQFGARPGWRLVTGDRANIERILKAFGVYTPNRVNHAPVLFVGSDITGNWTRANAFLEPAALVRLIDEQVERGRPARRSAGGSPAGIGSYFGDIELVNQDGQTMRLYSDLLRGKVVVVNSFFATCTATCPVMSRNFAALQSRFADRLGKDLWLISITVDPQRDTPSKLKDYAMSMKAGPGWLFLTGEKQNVDRALSKFGHFVQDKTDHVNIIIIGNEKTGLWKKAFGLARAEDLIKVVEGVLDDRSHGTMNAER